MDQDSGVETTRSRPTLKLARFPSEVGDGALVFAEWNEAFVPAIKWKLKINYEEYQGLAFLRPVDESYQHPLSITLDDGCYVAVVESGWQFRLLPTQHTMSFTLPTEPKRCGLVITYHGMYIRVPHIQPNSRRLSWQLINLDSGLVSSTNELGKREIFIEGWGLFLEDQKAPIVHWPSDEAQRKHG